MSRFLRNTLTIRFILKTLIVSAVVVGILWYIFFQARQVLAGPKISFIEEPTVTQGEQTVLLRGKTENITALTVNGKSVFTNQEGDFEHVLVLENGYTIMTLHAQDRYGRTTSLSRNFVYAPTTETN